MSDYHADLQQQADQRQIQQERERQERLVDERRHAARLEELWPRSNIDLKKQQVGVVLGVVSTVVWKGSYILQ